MKTVTRPSVRSVVLLSAILVAAGFSGIARAQAPRSFSYQGLIATPSGQPIADGVHTVSVSLYSDSTGSSALFSEAYPTHTRAGVFSVVVGGSKGIPQTVSFGVPLYLGVSVDGGSELVPRTALVAVPYAVHSEVADVANGLSSDASGVVTSMNEISGALNITGDSTISVTQNGKIISLHATAKGGGGFDGVTALDKSVLVQNPSGPTAGIRVADNGITTTNIADGAVTPVKINQAGATLGQILKWNGTKWVPANDSIVTYIAGNGITITGSTVSVSRPLPAGTVTNSTLRWDGTNWVENQNLQSTQQGLTTINNSLYLANGGNASELRFYEPFGQGSNYTSFRATGQSGDIAYVLPAALPATNGFLRVDNLGNMSWVAGPSGNPSFDQITSGTNQNQTLTVGSGTTLAPSGTGIVTANRFVGTGSVTNSVDLGTSEVAGILPIQNGGTNSGTALNDNRLMVSSNGAIIEFAPGTAGQVLVSNGNTMPSWATVNLLPNGTTLNSTMRWNGTSWVEDQNVLESSAGQVTVNAGVSLSGAASPVLLNGSPGTSGQVLTSNGAGATPSWTTVNLLPTGTTTNSTLRWNGTAWVENTNVLETSSGQVTANAGANLNGTASPLLLNNAAGTTGQVLTSDGAGATPTWTTVNLLPTGTTTNSTLRWNGTAWVENTNVLETSSGQVTANAGANLNGTASPLLLNNSAGTTGQVLTSSGTGATPTWSTVNLLPTGTTTNSTLRWNGTSWVEDVNVLLTSAGQGTFNAGVNLAGSASPLLLNNAAGTTGQVLTSAGAGATPTWSTVNLLPTGTTTNSTLRWNGTSWVEDVNVLLTSAGQGTFNAGANLAGTASPMLLNNAAGTSGQVLTSAGANATPTWTTVNLLPTGTITNSTLRWNGTSWVEDVNVLLTSAGQGTFNAGVNLAGTASPMLLNNAAGTTGQILTSAGAGATPTWTTVNLLPTGTTTNSTLRWNGAAWVEDVNVLETSTGQVTVNAGEDFNGTASPLLLNNSAGTTGQVLTSAGIGATPTWSTVNLLPTGTVTNSTLRWNGTSWVEDVNVLLTSAGQGTFNAGVNLAGTASPMLLNNAAGTSGQVLTSAGAGATPTWSTVNILPTGTTTNSTLRWNGTSWVEDVNVLLTSAGQGTFNAGVNLAGTASPLLLNNAAGTTGQVLTSAGAGATPTWSTVTTIPAGTVTNSTLRWSGTAWVENTNVLETSAGLVTANAGVDLNGTASPLEANGSAGTSGQVLVSAGAGNTPTWSSVSTLPSGTVTNSTLRWNGTNWVENTNVLATNAGQVTVNNGQNFNGGASPILLNNSAGTSGQFLTSAGTGATPTWTTGSLLPNGTATDNTLRWSGTQWVETANVKSSVSGLVTVNAGVNLNGAGSPLLANGSAGTTGQVLVSAGPAVTPSWTTINVLPTGTTTNSTLRWSGTGWVENTNVLATSGGQVTVNAGQNFAGTASPLLLNNSAGTSGQFLMSNGAGSTPSWTTGSLLPNGTATDNTLRWNGSQWVETANVKSSAAGLVTVNAGVALNGTSSPILAGGVAGNSGQVLTSAGAGLTPTWSTVNTIANGTTTNSTLRWSGTAWVENTNVLSTAGGQVTVQNGVNLGGSASPLQANGSAGTSGQFLMSGGAGVTPTWATGSLLPAGTATDNTLRWNGTQWVETANVKSSAAGLVTVQAGANLSGAASPLLLSSNAGTSGQFLISQGAGATPTWTSGSLLANGTATDNTLRWNGSAWVESSVVKSSTAGQVTVSAGVNLGGTASPLQANGSAGTSGQVLVSAGAGVTPSWTTLATLPTGTILNSTLRWNGASWVENTNILGTSAGLLTVNAGVLLNGTASPMLLNNSAGTSGQFLASAGPGATPTWVTGSLLPNGTATDNTLRWNGTSWVETANVKSSAAGMLTANAGVTLAGTVSPMVLNASAGTAGQVLTSAGAGATPTWTTPATINAGTAVDNTLRWNGTNWVETANVTSSAAGLLSVAAGMKLNSNTTTFNVRGSDGTLNYVLAGMGTGNAPQWTDPNTLINAWKLSGNTGTTPGTGANQNYMGTTDAKDLVFATNSLEHLRISSEASTIASTTTGVLHSRSVLPGSGSGLLTGMTVETLFPNTAGTSGFAVGGLYANSTLNNSVTLPTSDVFEGFESAVNISGSAGTGIVRANDGVVLVNNSIGGLTHSSLIGNYGTIRTFGSASTTITNGAAFRSDFILNNANAVVTTAYGLYVENPILGAGVGSTAVGTFNGMYVENLTNGTTRRAFLYDGSGTNVPVAITSAGQIGIGRKDPTQALEIYNGNLLLSNNTNAASSLSFAEPSGSGSNISKFMAQAQAADIVYTLPSTQPSANQVLTASSVSGTGPYNVTLTWTTPSGGGSGWSTTGNSGTTAGTNFIGTTDNVALDIEVNSVRVMEYQPNATSANILGGYSGNQITNGAVGSVIAGGGANANTNTVSDNYGFIGGGSANSAGSGGTGKTYATVVGGFGNAAAGQYSFVGGGSTNTASAANATIGGGLGNAVSTSGSYGTVGGGHNNLASSAASVVSGGEIDTATGQYSTVAGGQHNVALGQYQVISGGTANHMGNTADYSVIAGGKNLTLGANSFGVNMGTAADVSATSGIAYFGNMNLLVNNTDGTARKVGVNTNAPNTGVDVNGDVAMRQTGFTAGNGNNNDISIGSYSFVRITGPNAAFTITGISGGVDGKMVVLFNSTNQTMTVSHLDAGSTTAADRILCKAGNNVSVGQYGVVTLIYSTNESRWVVVSTN